MLDKNAYREKPWKLVDSTPTFQDEVLRSLSSWFICSSNEESAVEQRVKEYQVEHYQDLRWAEHYGGNIVDWMQPK